MVGDGAQGGFVRGIGSRREGVVDFGAANDFPALPDGCARGVGPDFSGIAPGVDREERTVERRSEVHRSAVDADYERSPPHQPDQFEESGSVRQVDDRTRQRIRRTRIGGEARNDHRRWRERRRESGDLAGIERFPRSACERMHEIEPLGHFAGDGSAGRQFGIDRWKAASYTERLRDPPAAVNGVSPRIDGHGVSVEDRGAFTGVGHAGDEPRPARPRHDCAPEQSLEVERHVRMQPPET